MVLITVFSLSGCGASMRDEAPFVLTGKWHRVASQDTVAAIAALYGVDAESLAELNDVRDDRALLKREEIFVPMRTGKTPGAARAALSAESAPKAATSGAATSPTPVEPKKSEPAPVASPSKSRSCTAAGNPCLMWPLDGQLGAGFGTKNAKPHDGIDILAEKGALIHAAADGEVLYSGNEIKGYGNLVILRHPDGILTVYAHNDKNLVTEGARVDKGAVIAEAGQSGGASVSHLHFEVRAAEVPQDPLEYLPEHP